MGGGGAAPGPLRRVPRAPVGLGALAGVRRDGRARGAGLLLGARPPDGRDRLLDAAGGAGLGAGPVQRPRIPLLIAGGGERVTLRQVARYADASNFGAHEVIGRAYGAADVVRKLAALRRHCEELGRPYDGVLRTHLTMP